MLKLHVKADATQEAIQKTLEKVYWNYYHNNGMTEPPFLYASNNFGMIFPYALCKFAIKNGLRIKFVDRTAWEEPFFYFGDENAEKPTN